MRRAVNPADLETCPAHGRLAVHLAPSHGPRPVGPFGPALLQAESQGHSKSQEEGIMRKGSSAGKLWFISMRSKHAMGQSAAEKTRGSLER